MNYDDDRTSEEKRTHTVLLGGRDRCLSGWGLAGGGASWAFWACRPEDTDVVLAWVLRRTDLYDVQHARRLPTGPGHCHTYVVRIGHPALISSAKGGR